MLPRGRSYKVIPPQRCIQGWEHARLLSLGPPFCKSRLLGTCTCPAEPPPLGWMGESAYGPGPHRFSQKLQWVLGVGAITAGAFLGIHKLLWEELAGIRTTA